MLYQLFLVAPILIVIVVRGIVVIKGGRGREGRIRGKEKGRGDSSGEVSKYHLE